MSESIACYCGCHNQAAVTGTHVDPDTLNPVCRGCLTFALDEDLEVVCSRSPMYEEGRAGWEYHDVSDAPTWSEWTRNATLTPQSEGGGT